MAFVIKAFDKYYIKDCGDYMEEVYDLYSATWFDTKEQAKSICAQSTYAEYFKVVSLAPEKKSFDTWTKAGMPRRKLDKIDPDLSRKYTGSETLEEVIQFYIDHYINENKISSDDYGTWPSLFEISSCLLAVQRYLNNDFTESWLTVKVGVRKTVSFSEFEKEVTLALPFITYMQDDFYSLPIMDHELSAYESRYLLIHKEKDSAKIIGSRDRIIVSGTLQVCFNIIQEEFYYD
jgi:hypothetical protein